VNFLNPVGDYTVGYLQWITDWVEPADGSTWEGVKSAGKSMAAVPAIMLGTKWAMLADCGSAIGGAVYDLTHKPQRTPRQNATPAVATPTRAEKPRVKGGQRSKGGKNARGGKGKKHSMVQTQGSNQDERKNRNNARANSNLGHGKEHNARGDSNDKRGKGHNNRGNAHNGHGKGKGAKDRGKNDNGRSHGNTNHGKGGKRR
jgi:hypothetical protein